MLTYLSGVPENLTKDREPFHNPKADILKNLLTASALITANKISADSLVVDLSCINQAKYDTSRKGASYKELV